MLINKYVTHVVWDYKSCYINATIMLIFAATCKMFAVIKNRMKT